ncbi:MAG: DUF4388 domain-containing protein [Deltaproteobacteria bacterium]|uniref:DUF4388 domain-containing protein n=1 Tax=Candidatus Zymogenus saltonus TaxID=2844893 RepID=A0A9D8KFS8_9DELT|nr:DUF4388 domain-containing protein [Candidatus Zymogenus saltonus]
MALHGDIKDFSVVDILQLLYQQQKSGVLNIIDKGTEIEVLFDSGMIISANSKRKHIDEFLGEMLLTAKMVSKSQLRNALEIQKETLKKLGDILIESGIITINDLRHVLKLQTHETIFKLLNLKSGTYNFQQRLINYDKRAFELINTEHFLMDSLRMTDEWPEIKEKIYSYNLVFEKMPGAEEEIKFWKTTDSEDSNDDLFYEDDKPLKGKMVMSAEERKVFDLVNETMTVRDLINVSRFGEFETTKALASLMDKTLIDIAFEIEEEKVTTPSEKETTNLSFYVVFGGIVFSLFLILAVSYPRIVSNFTISNASKIDFENSQRSMETANVKSALSAFYLIHGRYPDDLNELKGSGYLNNTRDDVAERFEYQPLGKKYKLNIRE